MTDDLGPTARALAHPKGSLTMTTETQEQDLIERVAIAIGLASPANVHFTHFLIHAGNAISAVRAFDREQRDKLHERLAQKSACGQPHDTP